MSSQRAGSSARGARERVESMVVEGPPERGENPMAHVHALRCRECGRTYDISPRYSCEFCFGPLEVAYDYDAVAATVTHERIAAGPPPIWRYAHLPPVAPTDGGLPVRRTPPVRADRPAQELGLREDRGKNDTPHP